MLTNIGDLQILRATSLQGADLLQLLTETDRIKYEAKSNVARLFLYREKKHRLESDKMFLSQAITKELLTDQTLSISIAEQAIKAGEEELDKGANLNTAIEHAKTMLNYLARNPIDKEPA